MAIQFARMEYVSRSNGGNACVKASYNKRDKVKDERTGITYSFAQRGGNTHHEIMLPHMVSEKFLDSSVLWNHVELFENRKNSQLAKEIVLALPDNKEITLEHRIELTRRFVKENFTDKGLGVQIDIHAPHHVEDKNWHAHLLVTTRRFREDGQTFESKKARDLDAVVRKGMVVEGDRWGEVWRDLQNTYFKEKGLNIRVDEIGAISQEHLGPVRMRHHLSEVTARGELLKAANTQASLDPQEILKTLTKTMSVFSEAHVDAYLFKHVRVDLREGVKERVLAHSDLVRLYDKKTEDLSGFYTTKSVRAEEERVIRVADRIVENRGSIASQGAAQAYTFSDEQKKAFDYCLEPSGIRVIQGRAGTGKSYLMQGLRDAYQAVGTPVIGLAPTHTVVRDMASSGFDGAKTIHEFLFKYKNDRISVESGSVMMVDEAGMLGTTAFGELLKVAQVHQCKVILVGDDRQLSSVERGGFFKVLADTFGSVELQEVRRQEVEWQRQVSENLSQGKINDAVQLLEEKGSIHWHTEKAASLSALVEDYSRSYMVDPSKTRLILSHRNLEVDVLNQAIQQIRQAVGQVSQTEYVCGTLRGEVPFAEGDRVQFMRTDKSLGLSNGEFGVLIEASKDQFKIQKDNGEQVAFDPSIYEGLRLGYASTIYKGQGKTVEEAYVLHSPLMTGNLSYVALTRQVKEVHLYVSQDEAKNQEALISQMSRSDSRVVSLEFMTAQQIVREQKVQESLVHKMAYGVGDSVRSVIQRFTDHLPNQSFYNVSTPSEFKGTEIREQNAVDKWKEESGPSTDKTPMAQKEGNSSNVVPLSSPRGGKESYDLERIEAGLKEDIQGFATYLLGQPDLKLSTRQEMCFCKDGKVFVNLQSGLWKDFVNDTGGNLFDLIQRERGGTFKESLVFAAQYLGQGPERTPPTMKSSAVKAHTEDASKEASAEVRQKVTALYGKTTLITSTVGERYFREHRGIRGDIPQDVRFISKMYNSELKQDLPAVVSFVRDAKGNLTGYQAIYLNNETGAKAELEITKRTHGTLSKSFVEIQKGEGRVYLSEGVETALSLKEAGVQGTILASLGIHNLKNYAGDIKNITLCADNDGPTAPTNKVIEKTKVFLEEKGYSVDIVRPTEIGKDFNDVLVQEGKESVASYFKNIEPAPVKSSEIGAEAKAQIQFSTQLPQPYVQKNSQAVRSHSSLTREYINKLLDIYQKHNLQEHPEFITTIAYRAAQQAFVRGEPKSDNELRILFAKEQYEELRLPVLKEELTEREGNIRLNWLGAHYKAEVLTVLEGQLFKEVRAHKDVVTKKDKLKIQESAVGKLQDYQKALNKCQKEAAQSYGFSEMHAKIFAQQKLLFEHKYGISMDADQIEVLKRSVEYGHAQYQSYKQGYTEAQTQKHGALGSEALHYIDQVSKYKAFQETKEFLEKTLTRDDYKELSGKELTKIKTQVERSFGEDKNHYDAQYQEQQKIERQQIDDQAKTNQRKSPELSI